MRNLLIFFWAFMFACPSITMAQDNNNINPNNHQQGYPYFYGGSNTTPSNNPQETGQYNHYPMTQSPVLQSQYGMTPYGMSAQPPCDQPPPPCVPVPCPMPCNFVPPPCDPCAPICGATCGLTVCSIGVAIGAVAAAAAIIIAAGSGVAAH